MKTDKIVTVCVNVRANPDSPSCGMRGGVALAAALDAAVAARGLKIRVERFNCLGLCERGPNIKLSPGGEFCHEVRQESLPAILDRLATFVMER